MKAKGDRDRDRRAGDLGQVLGVQHHEEALLVRACADGADCW
jgi:hypothetical protein